MVTESAVNAPLWGALAPRRDSFGVTAKRSWQHPEFGLRYDLSLQINNSAVVAELKIHEFGCDIPTLRNLVTSACQRIVDAVNLNSFDCITIHFSHYMINDQLFFVDSRVDPDAVSAAILYDTTDLVNLALTDNFFAYSLADFRRAVHDTMDTGMLCYRAIETLVHSFKNDGEKDKEARRKFEKSLKVEWSSIEKKIKPLSNDRRHGKFPPITGEQRISALLEVHNILGRYLGY